MKIYFLSSNENKINEIKNILNNKNIEISGISEQINEIQSKSIEDIAIDKALKAFDIIGRPVLVEQTGLFLEDLNGFPGGLTQIFWDSLKAEKFSSYFSNGKVTAKTLLAYCDGKQIKTYEGIINGTIASFPRGDREFQWDCIFQPEGYDQTFAEMGELKNSISMRKKALDKFKKYLEEHNV